MVAYLEKCDDHIEFHQIVDFLSSCSISYALTIVDFLSSCSISYALTQIHAIVDGKAVVISELSVRRDLLFDDEDGITCLTNDEIFENLALMGYEPLSTKLTFQKGNVTSLFDTMFVQNQAPEGEGSAIPSEPQPTPSTSQPPTAVSQTAEPQTTSTLIYEPQLTETQTADPQTVAPQITEPQILESQVIFHETPTKLTLQSPTTYKRQRKT
nr:hypothetical protein [Tanacetum cinerariifolium]